MYRRDFFKAAAAAGSGRCCQRFLPLERLPQVEIAARTPGLAFAD